MKTYLEEQKELLRKFERIQQSNNPSEFDKDPSFIEEVVIYTKNNIRNIEAWLRTYDDQKNRIVSLLKTDE